MLLCLSQSEPWLRHVSTVSDCISTFKQGGLVACRFRVPLYLCTLNPHVQPRVYVHASICNATSLSVVGGCKRRNMPQRMQVSPDYYWVLQLNPSRDSLHASEWKGSEQEANESINRMGVGRLARRSKDKESHTCILHASSVGIGIRKSLILGTYLLGP